MRCKTNAYILVMILLTLTVLQFQCYGMSFPTDQTWKKLKKEAKRESAEKLSPLQLFQSPLQPGGSWMLTVNPLNLWNLAKSKRLTPNARQIEALKTLEKYVDVLVDSDEAVNALRDSPALDNRWKEKLATLKAVKRAEYRAWPGSILFKSIRYKSSRHMFPL